MEENKIVEGNRVIAEWMGVKVQPELNAPWKFDVQPNKYLRPDARIKDLLYHSDWNWLIPVVEKIESLPHHDRPDFNYVVTIESGYCVISDNGEAPIAEAQWDGPKIDLVWHCVVKFIEWAHHKQTLT